MTAASSILTTVGVLLMAHAAYSTLHFRSILQDLGDVNEPIPPLDVYVELVLSFVILFVGQLMATGSLQSADVFSPNRKPLAAPLYRTRKFDIYLHAVKASKD